MTVLTAQAASDQSVTRADGAAVPAFADMPGATLTTSAGGDWAIMFSGMFLIPKSGTVEIQLVADGTAVPNSQRTMDVSAGGLMNDRCLTLEGKSAPGSGKIIKVQWRSLKGKVGVKDRRLMIFQ